MKNIFLSIAIFMFIVLFSNNIFAFSGFDLPISEKTMKKVKKVMSKNNGVMHIKYRASTTTMISVSKRRIVVSTTKTNGNGSGMNLFTDLTLSNGEVISIEVTSRINIQPQQRVQGVTLQAYATYTSVFELTEKQAELLKKYNVVHISNGADSKMTLKQSEQLRYSIQIIYESQPVAKVTDSSYIE